MNENLRILKITFLSLLLSACMTFEAPIRDAQPLDLPVGTNPVSASVGVYYSPAFLMFAHDESLMGQHTMHFDMGESAADHFDEVFLALFDNVKIINNLPPYLDDSAGLDGVIEPMFEQMVVDDPTLNFFGEEYDVTLVFAFRLLALDGETLASWSIRGRGDSELGFVGNGFGGSNVAADAASLALEDVSRQLLTGFRDVPGVDQWLNSLEQQ